MRRKEDQDRWQVKLKAENEALKLEVEANRIKWLEALKQRDEVNERLKTEIQYVDAAKMAAPDAFVWSGRPLPEIVKEMAENIKTLEAALKIANEKLKASEPAAETMICGDKPTSEQIDILGVKLMEMGVPIEKFPVFLCRPEPGDDMSLREVDDKPSEAEEARP